MITLVLYLLALVCFLAASVGVNFDKVNSLALGLSFWMFALLLGAATGLR